MTELEKQNYFLEQVGTKRAEKLQKIWNGSYPKFCSIPYGEEYPRSHSKEDVFKYEAEKEGFDIFEINLFLDL